MWFIKVQETPGRGHTDGRPFLAALYGFEVAEDAIAAAHTGVNSRYQFLSVEEVTESGFYYERFIDLRRVRRVPKGVFQEYTIRATQCTDHEQNEVRK